MIRGQDRLPFVVALLLCASTVLFALGTAVEHHQRGQHHSETTVSAAESNGTTAHAGEPAGSGESATGETTSPTSTESAGHSEKVAGIDTESWPLVSLAILISLAVATAVYRRRGRWLLVAAGFAALFAAADTRELVHQLNESRNTVAAIAGALIALHLLIAALAATAFARGGNAANVTPVASS